MREKLFTLSRSQREGLWRRFKTDSGMPKLLKRLDYRYKQPTPIPAKADTDAQAAWVTKDTEKRGS